MPDPHTDGSAARAAPDLRLHLVTLGVADLARAAAFYGALGLERRYRGAGGVAFLLAGHVVLGLYPTAALADDARLRPEDAGGGFGGVTLAFNVAHADAPAQVIARAVAAGGRCLKPAQPVFWGGVSGYFADLDGHVWEVAFNPGFPFDAEGRLVVPEEAPAP
ncbi:VOC family protein [Xanthobacter sp. KR7-225]|uniref:VOC family protein n=1 Tax=Xanthobacter sp. KR7-225 TaxID=3156613 RepID=UPI0032B46FBC